VCWRDTITALSRAIIAAVILIPHSTLPNNMTRSTTYPTAPPTERAFLVGVELKNKPGAFAIEDSMAELARLADTAGLIVVGQTVQKIARFHPATMIGKGKLE